MGMERISKDETVQEKSKIELSEVSIENQNVDQVSKEEKEIVSNQRRVKDNARIEELRSELTGEDGINEKNKIPKLIENAKKELQHQLDLAQSKYENDLKHYPGEQHRAHIDSIRDKRIKQAQERHDDRIKFLNKVSEENLNSAA